MNISTYIHIFMFMVIELANIAHPTVCNDGRSDFSFFSLAREALIYYVFEYFYPHVRSAVTNFSRITYYKYIIYHLKIIIHYIHEDCCQHVRSAASQ